MARKKSELAAADGAPTTPYAAGFSMPAEWAPHAATWLAWPHEKSDWPGKFEVIPWVFAEIARVLTQGERVRLLVQNAAEKQHASAVFKASGVDLTRVDFVTAATDRSWTRDFVPSFVVRRGRGKKNELAAVRFRFDGWKRYKNHQRDVVAGGTALAFLDTGAFEPVVTLGKRTHHVVLEGGAIDVDGEGTLLATEECLLDGKQARNPELGRGLTEQVLRDFLGAQKVVWLGRGIAGDDTGGHIDDFARFVAPGKVVVAQELDKKDPNYRVLGDALERLRGARDARGRRLDIVPLPMPAPIVFERQRLPASYANFYVASHAVLVPVFNDPNDRVALGILSELFPERDIVPIYSRDLVLGLGTLHCSTQQEPLH
ncbi:MAG TPA: agmatine deiminase family protein [Polyangiaceae bacterium]|nr:agmatine deiminase family protein [Polyangiaceae bacterium]